MRSSSILSLATLVAAAFAAPLPHGGDSVHDLALPKGYLITPSAEVEHLIGHNTNLGESSIVFLSATPEAANGPAGLVTDRMAHEGFASMFVTLDSHKHTLSLAKGTEMFPNRANGGSVFLSNKYLTYGDAKAEAEKGMWVEEVGFEIKKDGEVEYLGMNGQFDKVWTACKVAGTDGKASEWRLRWTGPGGLSHMAECVGQFALTVVESKGTGQQVRLE